MVVLVPMNFFRKIQMILIWTLKNIRCRYFCATHLKVSKIQNKKIFPELIFEKKKSFLSSKFSNRGHATKRISLKKTTLLKEIQLWQTNQYYKTSTKINFNVLCISNDKVWMLNVCFDIFFNSSILKIGQGFFFEH